MNNYFLKAKSTGLLILTSASINLMLCAIASAQKPTQILDTNSQTENNKSQFSNIVNNFELNITNQQINKQNYQASTSLGVGQLSKNGISLNIGASVQASQIKMQLRNVQGQVHFRASSKRLQ